MSQQIESLQRMLNARFAEFLRNGKQVRTVYAPGAAIELQNETSRLLPSNLEKHVSAAPHIEDATINRLLVPLCIKTNKDGSVAISRDPKIAGPISPPADMSQAREKAMQRPILIVRPNRQFTPDEIDGIKNGQSPEDVGVLPPEGSYEFSKPVILLVKNSLGADRSRLLITPACCSETGKTQVQDIITERASRFGPLEMGQTDGEKVFHRADITAWTLHAPVRLIRGSNYTWEPGTNNLLLVDPNLGKNTSASGLVYDIGTDSTKVTAKVDDSIDKLADQNVNFWAQITQCQMENPHTGKTETYYQLTLNRPADRIKQGFNPNTIVIAEKKGSQATLQYAQYPDTEATLLTVLIPDRPAQIILQNGRRQFAVFSTEYSKNGHLMLTCRQGASILEFDTNGEVSRESTKWKMKPETQFPKALLSKIAVNITEHNPIPTFAAPEVQPIKTSVKKPMEILNDEQLLEKYGKMTLEELAQLKYILQADWHHLFPEDMERWKKYQREQASKSGQIVYVREQGAEEPFLS